MASLPEVASWVEGIYQLETSDPVLAGPGGIDNRQATELGNRTAWLKQLILALQESMGDFAPLDSPDFVNTPKAPTAPPGTNSTQLANTAFVQAAIAALVASSPAALDTLNELAAAMGNDPNFAATITNSLSGKAALGALNVFTKGNVATEKVLPAVSGTVTLDLADGNNFGGQLTGNITLANPSNMVAGQSGILRIVNDAATPRTIAYGAFWKSPSGVMPALTAVAGAVDVFGYYVESATRITLVQQGDVK